MELARATAVLRCGGQFAVTLRIATIAQLDQRADPQPQVALADRSLDKYEDYLIGKLGELLYVSRGDVIRLKHRVTQRLAARDD